MIMINHHHRIRSILHCIHPTEAIDSNRFPNWCGQLCWLWSCNKEAGSRFGVPAQKTHRQIPSERSDGITSRNQISSWETWEALLYQIRALPRPISYEFRSNLLFTKVNRNQRCITIRNTIQWIVNQLVTNSHDIAFMIRPKLSSFSEYIFVIGLNPSWFQVTSWS